MTRNRKGLDALRDAVVQATPMLYALPIGDIPRTGLTVKEVAASTGLKPDRIRQEIRNRRLKVITGGNAWILPASEILVIMSWADYLAPLA